jgi:hypothetical protein
MAYVLQKCSHFKGKTLECDNKNIISLSSRSRMVAIADNPGDGDGGGVTKRLWEITEHCGCYRGLGDCECPPQLN